MKIILCIIVILSPIFSFKVGAKEFPISSGRSIQQRADSLFEMVSKELIFSSKKQEKFKLLIDTIELD